MVQIPASTRSIAYAPVASTGPFPIPFPLFDDTGADLLVTLDDVVVVDWTFSGTLESGFYGAPNTWVDGSITFGSPVSGALLIRGKRAPRRPTQFQEGRGIPARDHNTAYNELTAVDQELRRDVDEVADRLGDFDDSIAAVEDLYDLFDDRVLGAFDTPPTTDNDGNPLQVGAIYFQTTGPNAGPRFWDGDEWTGVISANLAPFVGDTGTGGEQGQVPAPAAGDAPKVLVGGGVWSMIVDAMVDAAAAISAAKLAFTETGTGAVARALNLIFQSQPLQIEAFKQSGDGADYGPALQRALTASAAQGRVIGLPSKTLNFDTGATWVPGARGIIGAGRSSIMLMNRLNGPLITVDMEAAGEGQVEFRDFCVMGSFESGDTYTSSRFLLVRNKPSFGGPNGGFAWSRFTSLCFFSLYAAIEFNTNTHTTAYGQESFDGWNTFRDLEFRSGSKDAIYGLLFSRGSSTGNEFYGIKSAATGAAVYWLGSGAVVGDIIYSGGHTGNGFTAKVGANVVYNRSMQFIDMQPDAGAIGLIQWEDPVAIQPRAVKLAGALGGSSGLAYVPPLRDSDVNGLGASGWREGGKCSGAPFSATSGAQVVDLWSIKLGPYSGCEVEVAIDGLVGGVDAGYTRRTISLSRQAGAVRGDLGTETKHGASGGFSPGAGWPTFTVVLDGSDNSIAVVRVSFTPNGQPSQLSTNIWVTGGAHRVLRNAAVVEL